VPEYLVYAIVAIVGTAIIWKGSDLLERSAKKLSKYYGLPPIVHGAIVVAIGSSFPELSSAVLSTLIHGEFELGLSAVVGSAIFNILLIPALSGLFSKEPLKAEKELVYKDAQFYLIAVAVLLLTFSFAVIYNPSDKQPLTGEFTSWLALIPISLYFLYIFIQQQEVSEQEKLEKPKDVRPAKEWLLLFLSLALVLVGVEGLVRTALYLEEALDVPGFVWGVTVIAIVTSLPDALISIRLAKKGEGVASLSNVLGSNIFDLLIAVPAGVLIAGSTTINLGLAAPLMAVLTFATILLFTLLRTRLTLSRIECWILLATYFLFVIWIVLENFKWVNFIPI